MCPKSSPKLAKPPRIFSASALVTAIVQRISGITIYHLQILSTSISSSSHASNNRVQRAYLHIRRVLHPNDRNRPRIHRPPLSIRILRPIRLSPLPLRILSQYILPRSPLRDRPPVPQGRRMGPAAGWRQKQREPKQHSQTLDIQLRPVLPHPMQNPYRHTQKPSRALSPMQPPILPETPSARRT